MKKHSLSIEIANMHGISGELNRGFTVSNSSQLKWCSFNLIIFLYTCLQLWTDKLSDSSEGSSEVSIQTDLAHLALDIIGRCAFGFNFNTVLSGESEISRAFSVVIKGVNFGRLMKKRLIPFYNSLPLDDNIKEQKSFEKTDETVLKVNNTTVFFYHFNFMIIILSLFFLLAVSSLTQRTK